MPRFRRSSASASVEGLEPRKLFVGTITGTVFRDIDADGTIDAGETALSGRTVFLDTNYNVRLDAGEASAVSDSQGKYQFTGIAAGLQHVVQLVPGDWKRTIVSLYTSTLPAATLADGATLTVNLGSLPVTSTLSLDPLFGENGKLDWSVLEGPFWSNPITLRQPDGRLLVGLPIVSGSGTINLTALYRFNADGSRDGTFGVNGKLNLPAYVAAIALQPNGDIIVSATLSLASVDLYRYKPDGSPDTSFANNGKAMSVLRDVSVGVRVRELIVQPDGKILVLGQTESDSAGQFALARVTSQGLLDPTFGSGGRANLSGFSAHSAARMALGPNGSVILFGRYAAASGIYNAVIIRVTSAGVVDSTFGGGTGRVLTTTGNITQWSDGVVANDGSVTICGEASVGGGAINYVAARFTSAGVPDVTFGTGGMTQVTANGTFTYQGWGGSTTLAVDPSGRVLVAGAINDNLNVPITTLVRLKSDGKLDPAFANGGLGRVRLSASSEFPLAIDADSDGRVTILAVTEAGRGVTVARIASAQVSPVSLDSAGALHVTGTPSTDVIAIGSDAGTATAWVNGIPYAYPAGSLTAVEVLGGGGDDTVSITAPVPFPVSFDGGTGADTLSATASSGNDVLGVTPGAVALRGGMTLTYAKLESLSIDAGAGGDQVDYADDPVTSPQTTLELGDGADVLNVTRGRPTQWLYVAGGSGNDAVNYRVNTDKFQNPWLSFSGDAGTDVVTVNGTAGADTIAVKQSGWDSAGLGGFFTTESFVVNGLAGNDVLRVDGTSHNVATTVNGGDGDDAFSIGLDDAFKNLHGGDFTVRGDGGADSLVFHDQQETIGGVYTVTPTTLTRSLFPTATYGDIERVTVNAGLGEDWLDVTPSAATAYVMNGGPVGDFGFGQTLQVATKGAAGVGFGPATGYTFADRQPITFTGILRHRLDIEGGGTHTFPENLGSAAAVGVAGGVLRLAVGAGATVNFDSPQQLHGLAVSGGGSVSVSPGGANTLMVGTLELDDNAGRLDLRDNGILIDYAADAESPLGFWAAWATSYTGASGMVQRGRSGGTWEGIGLSTSMPNAATGLTTLGVGEAATVLGLEPGQTATWSSITVDATTVIVKYSYAGDANLDGIISGDDYAAIDFNVAAAGASGYTSGDFNYDGIISGDDYSVIDFNIVAQGSPLTASTLSSASELEQVSPSFGAVSADDTLNFSVAAATRARKDQTVSVPHVATMDGFLTEERDHDLLSSLLRLGRSH